MSDSRCTGSVRSQAVSLIVRSRLVRRLSVSAIDRPLNGRDTTLGTCRRFDQTESDGCRQLHSQQLELAWTDRSDTYYDDQPTRFDIGLRHGPPIALDKECVVLLNTL